MNAMRWPDLMPSFFTSGVPEYPAIVERLLLILLSRQVRRIFVRAFAKHSLQSAGERDRTLAEFIAQSVSSGQRALPFLARAFIRQRELGFAGIERRNLHPQQPDSAAGRAITAKQSAHGGKNF